MVIELSRLFGQSFVEGLLSESNLPEDLSERTILISGRETMRVTPDGARELLRQIDILQPKAIIATHLYEENRTAFQEAAFDIELSTDFAYVDYEDIPRVFIEGK